MKHLTRKRAPKMAPPDEHGLIRTADGLLWPHWDEHCYVRIKKDLKELPRILAHVRGFKALGQRLPLRTALQAGGNGGLVPIALAPHFAKVVTFEPDPIMFRALSANTELLKNVVCCQAGLSSTAGQGLFSPDRRNAGAGHMLVEGSSVRESCIVTLMRADDLGLDDVDFIWLDVEGYEDRAIEGAWQTIERTWPTIALELKGLGSRFFGRDENMLRRRLTNAGYRQSERVVNDWVFTHASRD